MTKNIFIIAGEASGDTLGAGLMHALKTQNNKLSFTGIGGDKMKNEGLDVLLPLDEIAVMGIWEVLWQLPRLLKIIDGIVQEIENRAPDILITIDAQEFSLQVAQRLKKRGKFKGKLVHYVAPTVWAWRPARAQQIATAYDLLLCLFPFEPAYFTPLGLKAEYVGHPLITYGLENIDATEFKTKSDISPNTPVLGLFLGSREREIQTMAKPFAKTVEILREQIPDLHVIAPTIPSREYEVIDALRNHGIDAHVIAQPEWKWQAFAACDAALAVSGTVGLELAYMGVPHIIGYKTDILTYLVVRILAKIQHAHLANILLGRAAIPEFLQHQCDPVKMASVLLRLYKNEDSRMHQKNELQQLQNAMRTQTEQSPSVNAAQMILALV